MNLKVGTFRGNIRRRSRHGKTLSLELWIRDDKVDRVVLAGDFFAYPAEALEGLEKLRGININELEVRIRSQLSDVSFAGICLDDILNLIKELLSLYLKQSHQKT